MSKKNGTSWLAAVKRAFWSPSTKDSVKKKIQTREQQQQQQQQYEHQQEDYKKREKRGWLFRKTKPETTSVNDTVGTSPKTVEEDKTAAAVAAAAAESAAAAADSAAAKEFVKLTATPGFIRRHWAAIIVQTAFRGYLARRALRALKGIVQLQALVRGHNVRRQAKLTLKCIQALVRVQDRVLHHQRSTVSSSNEARRNSMFAESTLFSDSKYLREIHNRRSLSRDMSCRTDEWDDGPLTNEETESILQKKLEAALKREKALAYAFSNQIRSRSPRNPSAGDETELLERTKWLDRWMATKLWDDNVSTRSSTDHQHKIKVPIKDLEIDTNNSNPRTTPTHQKYIAGNQPLPATPPSCRVRPTTVRSASPRISYSPCARPRSPSPSPVVQPNYMTATESAKARARPQSTPRRRPGASGGSARKRLSYVEDEKGYDRLRSPSFKSAYNGCFWGDHESDYSCCYAGGFPGEISPCSTTDLRWLK